MLNRIVAEVSSVIVAIAAVMAEAAVAIVVQARAVVMVEAIVAAVDNRSVVAYNLVAADIVDMGLVAAASRIPFTTLHNTLSIECIYVVQRNL